MRPNRRSTRLRGGETEAMQAEEANSDLPSKDNTVKDKVEMKGKKKKKHQKNKENRQKKTGIGGLERVFERRRDDGSTSLAILTPGEGVGPGKEMERTISLGSVVGRVKSGTASLMGFREDRRNTAKPMYPIYYGGYSSHGPTYDSTFANMTVEESVLVSPYFDFRKLENEGLIKNVCRETDYSETFVEHLLDLFNGREIDEEGTRENKNDLKDDENIDFDYLRTLENDGIDMSFMSSLQAVYETNAEAEAMSHLSLEQQLSLTAKLIADLAQTQTSRLSRPPPQSLTSLPGPDEAEARLAEQVVTQLGSLASRAGPGQVVDSRQVRRAMGIQVPTLPPVSFSAEDSVSMPVNGDVNAISPVSGEVVADTKTKDTEHVVNGVVDDVVMNGFCEDYRDESMTSV